MCTYFNTKTDVAQNLINDFFLLWLSEDFSIGRINPIPPYFFPLKNYGGTGLISRKTDVLYAERNKRAEVATGSYSATGDSLQHIYSVPVSKNHRNIRSECLVQEFFFFTCFFNDINHGYRAAMLKKSSLWLLQFYVIVATFFYYRMMRRTMRTAIVSNLLNTMIVITSPHQCF